MNPTDSIILKASSLPIKIRTPGRMIYSKVYKVSNFFSYFKEIEITVICWFTVNPFLRIKKIIRVISGKKIRSNSCLTAAFRQACNLWQKKLILDRQKRIFFPILHHLVKEISWIFYFHISDFISIHYRNKLWLNETFVRFYI